MVLVGRRTLCERIATALDDDRVVVLVGPPGIGKSVLAAWFCLDQPAVWIDASMSLDRDALAAASTGLRSEAELVVIDGVATSEPADRLAEVVAALTPQSCSPAGSPCWTAGGTSPCPRWRTRTGPLWCADTSCGRGGWPPSRPQS